MIDSDLEFDIILSGTLTRSPLSMLMTMCALLQTSWNDFRERADSEEWESVGYLTDVFGCRRMGNST